MFSGEYLERLGASLSHLEAIYKYDDGAAALILEDDAKPDLIPTWSTDFDGYVERLQKIGLWCSFRRWDGNLPSRRSSLIGRERARARRENRCRRFRKASGD